MTGKHDDWGQNYFDALDIMEIKGPVLDGNNWTLLDSLYPPGADEALRTRGVYEVQRSRSGLEYRWSMPARLLSRAGRRRDRSRWRSDRLRRSPRPSRSSAADQVLGTVTLGDQSWVTIKHALPPPANPAAHWLDVHVDPPWRPRGEARMLGVQTRDIIFSP